jgi:SAM-dependent methyltransferase
MQWPWEIVERDHDIQNPTSPDKIRRLGEYMRLDASRTVLDIACGKAGPAIVLAKEFGCRVIGVEIRPGFAETGRDRVAAAGLSALIDIVTADASTYPIEPERFDAAICLGAGFVWGHIGDAARVLRGAVPPGGSVAVGEPFWRDWPVPEPYDPQYFVDLLATSKRFEDTGLSLVGMIASSEDDWDHYESRHWRAIAEWLASNLAHPDAEAIRLRDAEYRLDYLRHERSALGWAIFVGRRG